ncbi:unnamed protein product [Closterium sp. NIES-54]
MNHAVRVHNLLSTTAITGNSSPHVKWTGTKGNTSMLRVWGCMVKYRPPTSSIGKFASRAHWGVHLGISHEDKAWLILDLMSQKFKNACAEAAGPGGAGTGGAGAASPGGARTRGAGAAGAGGAAGARGAGGATGATCTVRAQAKSHKAS